MKLSNKSTVSPVLLTGLIATLIAAGVLYYSSRTTQTTPLVTTTSTRPSPTPPLGAITATPTLATATPVPTKDSEKLFYKLTSTLEKKEIMRLTLSNESSPFVSTSKDGKVVVFAEGGDLKKYDQATGTSTIILKGVPYKEGEDVGGMLVVGEPYVSPDGKYVAYDWGAWEVSGFGIVDIDGKNNVRLETCYSSGNISWSSDSQRFAIASRRNDFGGDDACLYIASASKPKEGKQLLLKNDTSYSPDVYKDPSDVQWSPDNSKLAFGYRYLDYTDNNGWDHAEKYRGIYTVNADGTDFKQVTNNQSFSTHPVWLNNDTIVYGLTNKDVGSKKGLFSIKADGSSNTQLFTGDPLEYEPFSVSPDGGYVLFRGKGKDDSGTLPIIDELKQYTLYAYNMKTGAVTTLGTQNSTEIIGWQ
jgi:hypothetical protein